MYQFSCEVLRVSLKEVNRLDRRRLGALGFSA